MDNQHQDLLEFVSAQTPFSQLQPSAAEYFVRQMSIVFISKDNQSQWLDSNKPCLFLVRSGLFDLISKEGEIVARLNVGDYFGYPSLLTGEVITNQLEAKQDGLVYVLEQDAFDYLRQQYKVFEQHFVRAHAKRLLSSHYTLKTDNWSEQKISDLMARNAVTLTPKASIRQAAKKMSAEGVSSIIVTQNEQLIGVVTDRDLRNRVLAAEVEPERSIELIMTKQPKFIFANNRVFSAMHLMLKCNIHHLPVLNENHKVVGMITATDLLRQQKSDPVQLIGRIYKANTVADLKRHAKEVPELLLSFSHKVDDISLIGKLLSGITDALTARLIYLYQEEQGLAPTRFSWICFGSQAREEQTLHSDQDNGLVLPDNLTDQQQDYFKGMGEFVCQQLNECGIPLCPGNIMASNAQCRGTISHWLTRFSTWINSPTPEAMLNCKIFFDIRFIEGSSDLFSLFINKLNEVEKHQLFFRALAAELNLNSVPIGLFNQFKLQSDEKEQKYLDLKKRGIVIINDIVRLYALQHNIQGANTLERLEALKKQPDINSKDMENLKDCWRYLTQLRLNSQLQHAGLPSNCISPALLSSLEKHQLKEAFYLIKQAQQAATLRFVKGGL